MKECIYSIPLTEALKADGECPFCMLNRKIESDMVNYYLGDSVMTEENRYVTNANGFCGRHYKALYEAQKRLPLALMMQTHLEEIIKYMEEKPKDYIEKYQSDSAGIFSIFKGEAGSEGKPKNEIERVVNTCLICNRVGEEMGRVFDNFFYLYSSEDEFKNLFLNSKGVCLPHYTELLKLSSKFLSKNESSVFIKKLYAIEMTNLKRLKEDIDWYVKKFDYRFGNESWKNSIDAVERNILKLSSQTIF